MSNKEDAWYQYKHEMERSGINTDERNGYTAFMAGWTYHTQAPNKTDEQITRLARQVTKLAKVISEPSIYARTYEETCKENANERLLSVKGQVTKLERAIQYAIDNRMSTFDYDTWIGLCLSAGMDV